MHCIEVTTAQTKRDRLGAEAAAISDSLLHFIRRIFPNVVPIRIREILGSNLGAETSYPDRALFLVFFNPCRQRLR
jgi:hypothetical protein